MSAPNLHEDLRILTAVYYIMGAVAFGMMGVFIGLWMGISSEKVCLPIGIGAILATIAGGIYAARSLETRAESGPLAEWNSSIRTMGAINILVGMLMIAYPNIA